MISITMPLHLNRWKTISFPSTLYLCPVLDLLLTKIPPDLHPEIRLGLQEALVNAAKHGNQLDPSKQVVVKFSYDKGEYSWLICDPMKLCPLRKQKMVEVYVCYIPYLIVFYGMSKVLRLNSLSKFTITTSPQRHISSLRGFFLLFRYSLTD